MNQVVTNFLEFKAKTLLFMAVDGTTYVALKPVCEAIGVDYVAQYKNVKEDPILGPALSNQTMQVPGDQARSLACLPEMYVYGWIFSIKSASKELLAYKKECYDILYVHFHGTVTGRRKLLQEKAKIHTERKTLEAQLKDNELFVRLEEIRAEEARIGKAFKQLDEEEQQYVQGNLFG